MPGPRFPTPPPPCSPVPSGRPFRAPPYAASPKRSPAPAKREGSPAKPVHAQRNRQFEAQVRATLRPRLSHPATLIQHYCVPVPPVLSCLRRNRRISQNQNLLPNPMPAPPHSTPAKPLPGSGAVAVRAPPPPLAISVRAPPSLASPLRKPHSTPLQPFPNPKAQAILASVQTKPYPPNAKPTLVHSHPTLAQPKHSLSAQEQAFLIPAPPTPPLPPRTPPQQVLEVRFAPARATPPAQGPPQETGFALSWLFGKKVRFRLRRRLHNAQNAGAISRCAMRRRFHFHALRPYGLRKFNVLASPPPNGSIFPHSATPAKGGHRQSMPGAGLIQQASIKGHIPRENRSGP